VATDQLLNAAIRLRAITHNREIEATPEEQRTWDDRVFVAEAEFHKACIEANLIRPDETFDKIVVNYDKRRVLGRLEGEDEFTIIVEV
jgi:hypothetical protein